MNPRQLLEQYYAQRGTSIFEEDVKNLTNQGLNRPEAERRVKTGVNARDNALIAEEAERLGLISFQQKQQAYKETAGTGANLEAQGFTGAQKEAEAQRIQREANIRDAKLLGQPLTKPPQQQIQPTRPIGQQQQPTGQQQQAGQSTYTGPSIVDYLSSVGQDSSFAARQQLAQAQGIQNYTGTAQQNTQLLNQLRSQQQGQQGTQLPGTQLGQGQQSTQPSQYTVRSGDTLSQIAQRLGVKVSDLSGYRSGDPHKIFPGEVLTVGKKFEPTPSTDLPEPIDTGLDTGTDIDSTPEKTTPLTPAEEDYSSFLQNKSYDDFIDSFSQKLGLDGLLTEISNANAALKVVQDNKLKEIQDNNNNPWISEELRNRKNDNTEKKFEAKMRFEQENVTRAQKFYDQAREEAKFAAKLAVDQQNTNREFYYQAKQDALKAQIDALKAKGVETQVVSAGGRRLLINKQTGATIRDLGSSTSTLNVTGAGFSGTNGPDTSETPSVDTTGWDESDFSWYLDALIQSGQLD